MIQTGRETQITDCVTKGGGNLGGKGRRHHLGRIITEQITEHSPVTLPYVKAPAIGLTMTSIDTRSKQANKGCAGRPLL